MIQNVATSQDIAFISFFYLVIEVGMFRIVAYLFKWIRHADSGVIAT